MRMIGFPRLMLTALLLVSPVSLASALQLKPVTSGLSSPDFVGNAGDGSRRLFVVEQGGVVRVLQQGASAATVFLDISARIAAACWDLRSIRNTHPTVASSSTTRGPAMARSSYPNTGSPAIGTSRAPRKPFC